MARSIILVLVFLSMSTLNASAFLGFGPGGKSGNQSGSKNTTGNNPINTKPCVIECFKKGCAGGPTQVTKPDGTVVWTCSHCPDGNSCNDDTNCAAPTKCNSEGLCTENKEETGCPLTPAEELAAIQEAVKKAYDQMKAEGIDPCSANIGNIMRYYGVSNKGLRCDQINPIGETKVEAICKETIGGPCNFNLVQGFATGSVADHQFICVIDKSKPVISGKDPECSMVIDFWDKCDEKTGPKIKPVKDFRFNSPEPL